MKGFALDLTATLFILIVVIFVSIGIIFNYFNQISPVNVEPTDVKYACSQLNNSQASLDDFKLLMYGFLTSQCEQVKVQLKQKITINDIERAVAEIDKKSNVVYVSSCKLPSVSSHSVLVCCEQWFDENKVINISRRKLYNSDVLVCGQ